LVTLARQFHVPAAEIAFLNSITNADRLTEGQTLRIPHATPLMLVVAPLTGPQGQAFQLKLTGALPSETITFNVRSPNGNFTGPPHNASADGAVTATYQTQGVDPAGTYTVTATTSEGTTATATFVVLPSTSHT